MTDYLRIARAYLSGTSAAVWCFMFVCLLTFDIAEAVSAFDGEFPRGQGGHLGGVMSRKSYLAMFAYFNACLLGVLLRDNLARPWATLLPRYRMKHLLVTAIIALLFLAIPMFSVELVGTSDIAPSSVAVIFLACLAAGLWTPHPPVLGVVLVFAFLVFAFARSSSSPELAAFLAGTNPAASAVLALMSLLALWALARRLLALKEEMAEYVIARMWGDLLRGRGGQSCQGLLNAKSIEDHLAALPAEQRAALQNRDPLKNSFTNLNQVDNLSGYAERNLWQRSRLWRLGTTPTLASVSLGGQMLISLVFVAACVFASALAGVKNPAGDVVVIMSVMVMTNPFNIWLFWFMRLRRLGYESLRPRTRREFVRELGLALLWDNLQCWLGGVLFMGIAAAIWAPELLHINNILLFIFGTGAGQLGAYAVMGIWLLKQRGMAASVACAFCPFLIAIWIMFLISGRAGVEVNLALALVLAAASVATIPLAYRRWLRADLD